MVTYHVSRENKLIKGLDATRPSLIMSWCFGRTLGPLIRAVDQVQYLYDFDNGVSIGEPRWSD